MRYSTLQWVIRTFTEQNNVRSKTVPICSKGWRCSCNILHVDIFWWLINPCYLICFSCPIPPPELHQPTACCALCTYNLIKKRACHRFPCKKQKWNILRSCTIANSKHVVHKVLLESEGILISPENRTYRAIREIQASYWSNFFKRIQHKSRILKSFSKQSGRYVPEGILITRMMIVCSIN